MRINDWSSDVCSSDLRDGSVLERLPPICEGLVPNRQVVEHHEYLIDEKGIAPLPNAPFALSTPEGDPLPHGIVTRDLIHAFYNNQLQINGGRNDGFVAWGDSGALVMGHYGDNAANLRLWQIARDFTLCRSEEHTSELQPLMRTSYAV